jgi:hypothetical protein
MDKYFNTSFSSFSSHLEIVNSRVPSPPPLIIKYREASPPTPPPLILREAPPSPPPRQDTTIITRVLPPERQPSRQVILEHEPSVALFDYIDSVFCTYGTHTHSLSLSFYD